MKMEDAAVHSEERFFDIWMTLLSATIYGSILALLVANSTRDFYGFEVQMGPMAALGVINQFSPILVALALFVVAPSLVNICRSIAARWADGSFAYALVIVPVVSISVALLFAITTWLAMRLALPELSDLRHPATGQIWTALLFDISIAVVFAVFVHSLLARWWLTLLAFITYIAVVIFLAQRGVDISFIGFGTSSQFEVTQASTDVVNLEAGWLTRSYWLLITVAMLLVLLIMKDRQSKRRNAANSDYDHAPDKSLSRLSNLAAMLAIIVILTGAGVLAARISDDRAASVRHYANGDRMIKLIAKKSDAQMRALSADLDVTLLPGSRTVEISGRLDVKNESRAPTSVLLLSRAPTFRIASLNIDGQQAKLVASGANIEAFALDTAIGVGASAMIEFEATIDATETFDIASQRIVMGDAVFLGTDELVPLPASSACIADSNGAACWAGRSYIGYDPLVAKIRVDAPRDMSVAFAQRVSQTGDRARWQLDFPAEALGNLLLAAAKFRVKKCSVNCDGLGVDVYLAAYSKTSATEVQDYMRQELHSFADRWGPPPTRSHWFVEMPAHWSDAVSFLGGVAIGEHVMGHERASSDLARSARLVLSHEVAHQWWGYRVVPQHAPGSAFVVESLAQFAALARFREQGILNYDTILDATSNYDQGGRMESDRVAVQLGAISGEDPRAYFEGPMILTYIDREMDGTLLETQAPIIDEFTGSVGALAPPDRLMARLRRALPQRLSCGFGAALARSRVDVKLLEKALESCTPKLGRRNAGSPV